VLVGRYGRSGLNTGSWTQAGVPIVAATYGLIDNLVYNYKPNPTATDLTTVTANTSSNKLLNVKDFSLSDKGFKYVSTNAAPTYTYDDNGNLISDLNKKISKITYNYLNLPQVITFDISAVYYGKIEFVYDATGAKLKKIVTEIRENVPINERILVTTYDYINGAEYKTGVLQRFAHTEGSVALQASGAYIHEYTLRDHLGNTRVSFTDADNNGLVDMRTKTRLKSPVSRLEKSSARN
jgi:hypothetical protein